ncbi:hypothetical protein ACLKA7_000982 [Drosophila subpalustris]
MLLAQLMYEIETMTLFGSHYYCWSDSTVALSWIRSEPSKFNVFVSNRVAAIQELTKGMEFRHVPTDCNPADILSRGSLPAQLIQSDLWFNGPQFLVYRKDDWPPSCSVSTPSLELRKAVLQVKAPYSILQTSLQIY